MLGTILGVAATEFGRDKVTLIASPGIAIDLPLKALVWQDASDKVWLSYNSPAYLKERHAISDTLLQNIAGIGPICAEAVR